MNTNVGLLGRKIGMTQIYDAEGRSIPVTAVEAGPCTVLQVKTPERDGYSAIQLGFDDKPPRNVPDEVIKKAQGARARYDLQHGRTTRPARGHAFAAGETVEEGDFVDVIGTSKGRGFTGVIKRHGFALFIDTHGTHEWRRHAGSIGCRKPQHTRRGTRMAGQHGNARVTVQNLRVAGLLPDQNVVLIRGGIPGPNGGYVIVRKALKRKKKA